MFVIPVLVFLNNSITQIFSQKMLITLITLLAIATELHLLFSNKSTIHIYSIESVVKNNEQPAAL